MTLLQKIILFSICITFWSFQLFAENTTVSREEAFLFFAELIATNIPESYKYIEIQHKNVEDKSNLEEALQKLIYLDKIENNAINIYQDRIISRGEFAALTNAILELQVSPDDSTAATTHNDLIWIKSAYSNQRSDTWIQIWASLNTWLTGLSKKEKVLFDVYETLQSSHYDREDFTNEQLLNSAIEWLANGAWDTYTSYFPPADSTNFFEWLDGEYEGIWAYVEMPNPGELNIVSPISWGPAEEAGIKWWDRVIKVDGKIITIDNSLQEVISWIKWPSNTFVEIQVERDGQTINFNVERAKITLKDVEYEKINFSTSYIQIKNFWDHVAKDLKEILWEISEDTSTKKIIIDLRNNPGWYLDQVSDILSYFIPEWEPTAIVSYGSKENILESRGNIVLDLNDYNLVFLQNSGTASASEIMIGTLKDYFPHANIIWEQSFWKGSVQSLKSYYDGSTLKYTSAKWYTGWSRTGIDWVWITPDLEIELDRERLENFKKDTRLIVKR